VVYYCLVNLQAQAQRCRDGARVSAPRSPAGAIPATEFGHDFEPVIVYKLLILWAVLLYESAKAGPRPYPLGLRLRARFTG